MAVVAERQRAQGAGDLLRRDAGFLGEAQQGRLVRGDELQHAGEEAGFPRRLPDRLRLDAGDGQETRQKFGSAATRRAPDCQRFGIPVFLAVVGHAVLAFRFAVRVPILSPGRKIDSGSRNMPERLPSSLRVCVSSMFLA